MTANLPVNISPDYNDELHLYSQYGIRYLSVTQIIELFKNKFNVQEGKQYMVERYGGDGDSWGDRWKTTTDTSIVRGNRIHNENEEQSFGRGFEKVNGKIFQVRNINLFGKEPVYYNLPDGSYPELKLWRHDYKMAGRADKVTFETLSRFERIMHIEDYKTNRIIYTQSFKDKEGKYRMMKAPVDHLMDCHMIHYALQLSMYQFMGEYFGFLPGVRRIIHYKHEIEELGTPPPVEHQLPYYRSEVIAMLNHLKAA